MYRNNTNWNTLTSYFGMLAKITGFVCDLPVRLTNILSFFDILTNKDRAKLSKGWTLFWNKKYNLESDYKLGFHSNLLSLKI